MLLKRLIRRRKEAHRVVYLPWVLLGSLFAVSALSDARLDATLILAFLPLVLVLGHLSYPTVLGWAALWVPAVVTAVVVALGPQPFVSWSHYFSNLALLLGPALCVVLFPPRIRRNAGELRFIAATVVGILFGVVLAAFLLFSAGDLWKPAPPRRRAALTAETIQPERTPAFMRS